MGIKASRRTRLALRAGGVAVILTSFMVVGAHDAVGGRGAVGTITYVKGDCLWAKSSKSSWGKLSEKQTIYQGSRLKTEKGARLEAKLADGSMLRLSEKSELNLEKVSFNKKKKKKSVSARLVLGRIWASVTSLFGSDSKFEIKTHNAVAGVRGTKFAASRDASGNTRVKVYSGKVLISNRPMYAIKGHTKSKRVQVPGPQEITKNQWEELVAEAMQVVTIASGGEMTRDKFARADPAEDDWEAWNAERDKLAGLNE